MPFYFLAKPGVFALTASKAFVELIENGITNAGVLPDPELTYDNVLEAEGRSLRLFHPAYVIMAWTLGEDDRAADDLYGAFYNSFGGVEFTEFRAAGKDASQELQQGSCRTRHDGKQMEVVVICRGRHHEDSSEGWVWNNERAIPVTSLGWEIPEFFKNS